ncbi:hypothetical protein RJT34_01504 [Clitoria ternatea]|uniref:Uncharacterized protein n=1 Tax=Clitoria ternatea TaxID=43366 RepID=A0AAN9KJH1_CLITE
MIHGSIRFPKWLAIQGFTRLHCVIDPHRIRHRLQWFQVDRSLSSCRPRRVSSQWAVTTRGVGYLRMAR